MRFKRVFGADEMVLCPTIFTFDRDCRLSHGVYLRILIVYPPFLLANTSAFLFLVAM